MKFSIILATYNRKKEVESFINSLLIQTYNNFELIIVDQNRDGRLNQLIKKYSTNINIKHIKINKVGLSIARNTGISNATGEILAFPDDDCEYPENILERIKDEFTKNDHIAVLTGRCLDKQSNTTSAGKFKNKSCQINYLNVFKTAVSVTLFIKKSAIEDLKFDERLGLGAEFGAAEETDLLMRILEKKYIALYNPSIIVFHPNIEEIKTKNLLNRYYYYGKGIGAVIKKHISIYKIPLLIHFLNLIFIRPLSGIIINLLKLKFYKAKLYIHLMRGRLKGFFSFNKNY